MQKKQLRMYEPSMPFQERIPAARNLQRGFATVDIDHQLNSRSASRNGVYHWYEFIRIHAERLIETKIQSRAAGLALRVMRSRKTRFRDVREPQQNKGSRNFGRFITVLTMLTPLVIVQIRFPKPQ
ncbi:hypothetical protein FEE96_18960 [Parasedimentitalea maritima]|uniref:Transposase DDE domain-containing protein n=1 Tax=Parasedimentitalea maritima TaxID=2578117 RepID=A0ABY2UV61_9RHOB|nr:hypothetical protein [Zongyanglinia marina]TLP58512.1 hypothetical protein FEE96_18960 [Zongyanglinia marina]